MRTLPSTRAIKSAILHMNSDALPKENIEKVLKLLPTEEEIVMIQDALVQRPGVPLATAEQFLSTLNSIPELEARLKIWSFKLDFPEKERETAGQLSDFREALQQIKNCKTLAKVLACLLKIGNYLNNQNAKAFSLDYLQKAPEVRDTMRKNSLVHHVCDFLGGSQTSDLYSEMGAVTRCTRVDWDLVNSTLTDLEKKCRTSWEQIRVLNQQDNFSEDLKNKLTKFVKEAAQRTMILQTVWHRLMQRHRKLLRWLGITDFDEWGVTGTIKDLIIKATFRFKRFFFLFGLTKIPFFIRKQLFARLFLTLRLNFELLVNELLKMKSARKNERAEKSRAKKSHAIIHSR